jgi:hypothetical protein
MAQKTKYLFMPIFSMNFLNRKGGGGEGGGEGG